MYPPTHNFIHIFDNIHKRLHAIKVIPGIFSHKNNCRLFAEVVDKVVLLLYPHPQPLLDYYLLHDRLLVSAASLHMLVVVVVVVVKIPGAIIIGSAGWCVVRHAIAQSIAQHTLIDFDLASASARRAYDGEHRKTIMMMR